jgi:hypothetical protein
LKTDGLAYSELKENLSMARKQLATKQRQHQGLSVLSTKDLGLMAAIEDKTDHHGEPMTWRAPKVIPNDLRAAARREIDLIEQASYPAARDVVGDWLMCLGPLVIDTKRTTLEEVQIRISSYADLLDFPAYCYTRETLREAGEVFEYFPSYSRVFKFLSDIKSRVLSRKWRCQKILETGEVKREQPFRPTPEQKEKILEGFEHIRAHLKAGIEEK